jgi:pSer/pThr/pTyr-binding forkhead associated (FHA) protein
VSGRPDDDDHLPTVARQLGPVRTAQGIRIQVVAGPDVGLSASCTRQKVIVGRSPACDLRLSDPTASSFHAELSASGGGILVRDLESLNATIYQGARIAQAVCHRPLQPYGALTRRPSRP